MEMQRPIADEALIINSRDLDDNIENRSNMRHSYNIENQLGNRLNMRFTYSYNIDNLFYVGGRYSARVSRSMEDPVYILDSINLGDNHNHNMENDSIVRPANQESIKNLEMIRIEGAEHCSECSICLGTFSLGSEAICMPHPCSHIFHQHCIKKWLNISNTCPLCRRTI